MSDDDKLILEGVITEFDRRNYGRMYPKEDYEKRIELYNKLIKQEKRNKKIKRLYE